MSVSRLLRIAVAARNIRAENRGLSVLSPDFLPGLQEEVEGAGQIGFQIRALDHRIQETML